MGGDASASHNTHRKPTFQSTPPVWEATHSPQAYNQRIKFQSTPPVWEATWKPASVQSTGTSFNPRLPCGRRLSAFRTAAEPYLVSIHASRVGGDRWRVLQCSRQLCFNPRLPCGRRLVDQASRKTPSGFNPRLPCGRRLGVRDGVRVAVVSIHASRVGGDSPRLSGGNDDTVSIHASRVGGDE